MDDTSSATSVAGFSDMPKGACPYLHGTVDASPYPGYVHGQHPGICPEECTPIVNPSAGETSVQTLLREAREFCILYHSETKRGDAAAALRWTAIEAAITATGAYELTFDELQHGARVAWRNAPKCPNRSKWAELTVSDCRHVTTNSEMFRGVLSMLDASISSGATKTSMVVFQPRRPGEKQGPRVWNGSVLRFAGYEGLGSPLTRGVLGDPADAEFTSMLITRFGWVPPSPRSRWDVLPLLLQLDETQPPQLFSIPSVYAPILPIRHPSDQRFDSLGLRWFGIPVVSLLEITVGGLSFTACPFVGWFADTEVVRDLTDASRYNVLPEVARVLELDRSDENWIDKAILAVNDAVVHSFPASNFAIVSKHTLMREFVPWYRKELRTRGYCPGNWKWIIPPLAASTSEAYLGLSKMTEYTLHPAVLPPRPCGWRNFNDQLPGQWGADGTDARIARSSGVLRVILRTGMLLLGKAMHAMKSSRPTLLIAYASVTGTAAAGAERLAHVMKDAFVVKLLDLADFTAASTAAVADASVAMFVTSTYGSGAAPPDAAAFLDWAESDAARSTLHGLPFCVIGYGSRSYPRFAAAADTFSRVLTASGAFLLTPVAKVDALGGGIVVVSEFVQNVTMTIRGSICTAMRGATGLTAALDIKPVEPRTALAVVSRMGGLLRLGQSVGLFKVPPTAFLVQLEKRLERISSLVVSPTASSDQPHKWAYVRLEGVSPDLRVRKWGGHVLSLRVSGVEELLSASVSDRTAPAIDRSVVRVSLDTSSMAGGLSFLPGDNIAVHPRQTESAVRRAAAAFGWDTRLDEDFMLFPAHDNAGAASAPPFPTPTTLRTALEVFLAIEAPPRVEDLAKLSCFASGSDAVLLSDLLSDKTGQRPEAWLKSSHKPGGNSWVGVLERLPTIRAGLPSPGELIALLPMQRARYYSASSAPSWQRGRLELTVSVVANGVCSNYLAGLHAGSEVELRVISVPGFRIPMSLEAPILAIAAGSGIAPLRSFWQMRMLRIREARNATAMLQAAGIHAGTNSTDGDVKIGPFVLLFGVRSRAEQLYAAETEVMVDAGALSAAHIAFSREPGVPSTHVQHLLSRDAAIAADVRRLLAHPQAMVFICGDARIAAAAEDALRVIVGGDAVWAAFKAGGRYHEDVFGITEAA